MSQEPLSADPILTRLADCHPAVPEQPRLLCPGNLQSQLDAQTAELSATRNALKIVIEQRQAIEAERLQYVAQYELAAKRIQEQSLALQHAKELAEAANQTKSDFLANMSHEIRTPLTAILGYCDILRIEGLRDQLSPSQMNIVDTIRHAGDHLMTVISDILDLSKIEAGRLETEQIETDLPRILVEVDSLMRPRVTSKKVGLRTVLETPVPVTIISDPTRLRQILMNLIGNAAKFTSQGEVLVRVSVNAEQQTLQIAVEDTGAGMTAQQAEKLFAPFTQADTSVTRKHGGTGLGLTISRRLARMMGGEVRLLRTAPQQGSCFALELPLKYTANCELVGDLNALTSDSRDRSAAATVTLSGRILLAEDSLDNQQLIAFHLRKADATVDIADNGRIALEKIEAAARAGQPFDLLLTDMQMPEMDGYTLARTLRIRGVSMPIVALTAHAMAEDRQKCLDAGCDDYAVKPLDKRRLLTTCKKWLERAAAQSALPVTPSASPVPASESSTMSTDTLTSDLLDDPDLAEIVVLFLDNLGEKLDGMTTCLAAGQLTDVARTAHQLKGAGGGYGYPSISVAARELELQAKQAGDLDAIHAALQDLTQICQRAIAGREIAMAHTSNAGGL